MRCSSTELRGLIAFSFGTPHQDARRWQPRRLPRTSCKRARSIYSLPRHRRRWQTTQNTIFFNVAPKTPGWFSGPSTCIIPKAPGAHQSSRRKCSLHRPARLLRKLAPKKNGPDCKLRKTPDPRGEALSSPGGPHTAEMSPMSFMVRYPAGAETTFGIALMRMAAVASSPGIPPSTVTSRGGSASIRM